MTDERRAAPLPVDAGATTPDLPSSAGSTGELTALDAEGRPVRVPAASPSSPSADRDGPASRTGRHDSSPGVRKRGRMTLRIPDDEVARPSQIPEPAPSRPPPPVSALPPAAVPPAAGAPSASVPAPAPLPDAGVALVPVRIITINAAPTEAAEPVVAASEVPVAAPTLPHVRSPSDDMIPIVDEVVPASDSAPESIEPISDRSVDPGLPPPPPVRVVADSEGEDVRFEEDAAPTPATPAVDFAEGERHSDPGAELGAEDLVTVSSPPAPMKAPGGRSTSQPPIPPPPKSKITAPKLTKPPLVIVPPHVGTMAPQPADGPQRRKGRLWWEDLFNDDYLRACEKLTDEQIAREADFVEDSLSVERGGAVLDLGCGTGRHAIELARRGYEVVGYDLSLAMLARAGDEAQDREAKLNFIQGDMREMSFEEQFDGVFCWNTTFGYFEEERNALVVDRIHQSLKAEGLLLLDVVNRDFIIRQSPSLCWFEGDGCVCMDEMAVDFITSRMKVKRTIMLDDGRSREIEYSMRVYSLHELGRILHEHGFKVCEVSGRVATPGVFFGNESPRIIILAEKR